MKGKKKKIWILQIKLEKMEFPKIKMEKTEFGKKYNGNWEKIKQIL